MNRFFTLIVHLCIFIFACAPLLSLAQQSLQNQSNFPQGTVSSKPNFILVFLDDAGYGDFGYTGHPTIATPCVDRLASQGVVFSQWSVPSPACSASRYSLLTGRNPQRSGFGWVLMPGSPRHLHAEEYSLAELLKQQGYATAILGKWHLGFPNQNNQFSADSLPLAHGFDWYFGFPYSNDMKPNANGKGWPDLHLLEAGNTPDSFSVTKEEILQVEGEAKYNIVATNPNQDGTTTLLTDAAIVFLQQQAAEENPFFLYLAHPQPHVPLHPSELHRGKSRRGLYGDSIEEIDTQLARMIAELEQLELAEDTLVVFTSDNGPWIVRGLNGGSAGLFRDGKGSTWEGGVREPCIWYWPETLEPKRASFTASSLDILPTFVALAGGELPADRRLDGANLLPSLVLPSTETTTQEETTSSNTNLDERVLLYFGRGNEAYALRRGPWKLHWRIYSQTGNDYGYGEVSLESPLLFHLENDPSESKNVANQNPEIVADLLQEYELWLESLAKDQQEW